MKEIQKNGSLEYRYSYDSLGRQDEERYYEHPNNVQKEMLRQEFTYYDNGMLENVKITTDPTGVNDINNETYLYNADGQRIVKQYNNSVITKYLYSGSEVLMTASQTGFKLTENILDVGGQIIASQRFDAGGNGTGWYSYNYDIRKSTTAILDETGTLSTNYQYDSFGNVTNAPTSFLNETQFTGAISDSNTGLYYMNARYYNSNTGRFLSQDSFKGSLYEPWTQNLYSYVGNNPINLTDPTGHKGGWLVALGIATAVIAVAAIVVVSGGTALPLVAAAASAMGTTYAVAATATTVAAVAVTATGAATATMGGFDIVETFTGRNKLKEKLFKGNENAYYKLEANLADACIVGDACLGPVVVDGIVANQGSKTTTTTTTTKSSDNASKKYYHATSSSNAEAIKESGVIKPGRGESCVYAWESQPTQSQATAGGATQQGTVISFSTRAAFAPDTGITNAAALSSKPVETVLTGSIRVTDVKVVGYAQSSGFWSNLWNGIKKIFK